MHDGFWQSSLQVLSVTIFEKMPLQTAFLGEANRSDEAMDDNLLNLFSFNNRTLVRFG